MTTTIIDGGPIDMPDEPTTAEIVAHETWGATVQDVKHRLPHIYFGAPSAGSSNPRYAQNTTASISDDVIRQFIYDAAADVSARIHRYEQVPERTRETLRLKARAVVADGAAHYVQSAWFPSSSDPNNGSAYAERLWERFSTRLDTLGALVDDEADSGPLSASGRVSYEFPAPMFPDYEVF